MQKETKNIWIERLKCIGSIILFFAILTGLLWLMAVQSERKNVEVGETLQYLTIDEIVGIDCSQITSIKSSIGDVSDEKGHSDMDVLLNKKFKIETKEYDPQNKALYVEYTFYGTNPDGEEYILFYGREDIVNDTWCFSVTEDFREVYYLI